MADHKDLFEAALNAVNAVEAKSANEAAKNQPKTDPTESAYNAEDIDAADDLDFHLSVSAFNRIMDEDENASDNDDLLIEIDNPQIEAMPEGKDIEFVRPSESEEAILNAQTVQPVKNIAPAKLLPPAKIIAPSPAPAARIIQPAINKPDPRDDELKSLKEALAKANEENAALRASQKQLNDRFVRLSADFDNYRKRVARDQDQVKFQAEERIVSSFLGVMDNFERAIAHAKQSQDYAQLLQGVELTSKMYLATLAKHGCIPFESVGKEFDPVYHDVLQRIIDPDAQHNSIVQEHLKGYTMHDRVIRPALVVVAQHSEDEEETPKNSEETEGK
jgi:molecular chaperone GrpE